MPIKVKSDLPAQRILEDENIFVMDENRAMHQDIRPLKMLILNLMPNKEVTETQLLRKLFPFTAPSAVLHEKRSLGVGDRLGIASVGHIRAVEPYDAYPVLAQQSMRELNLTGRTYQDVLAAVTFQVLKAGYRRGYGADGDHLKTAEDIRKQEKAAE